MAKKITKMKTDALQELQSRIDQFVQLNSLVLENSPAPREADWLLAQNAAFNAVRSLVNQLQDKGRIWKGGYLDNVGPVKTDLLEQAIDEMKAQAINDEPSSSASSNQQNLVKSL